MLEDWQKAPVDERTRAALQLVEAMTVRPLEVDAALLGDVRDKGLDDPSIHHAAAICFHFNLMNRLAGAFGFEVPNARQAWYSGILIPFGARVVGSAGHLPAVLGEDGRLRPPAVAQTREVLFDAVGEVDPLRRRCVATRVRGAWSVPDVASPELDPATDAYVAKLARHAYRITDEDIEALRGRGLSDEAIYEITVAGAVEAASISVESLLAAIN